MWLEISAHQEVADFAAVILETGKPCTRAGAMEAMARKYDICVAAFSK